MKTQKYSVSRFIKQATKWPHKHNSRLFDESGDGIFLLGLLPRFGLGRISKRAPTAELEMEVTDRMIRYFQF